MSEEVKAPGTAIAHWKERMVSMVAATQQAEKPSGGFISLKGGRMTYADELIPGDKINAILVDYRFDNEFFPGKYDPSKPPVSPTCFAISSPEGKDGQSPWKACEEGDEGAVESEFLDEEENPYFYKTDAENPQVPAGKWCEDCPMNEWGSAGKVAGDGSRGKACKTTRRLHLLAADDCSTAANVAKAALVTLVIPATSVENFSKFMNQVSSVLKTVMFGVVVEVSVKPHPKFQFQAHFKILEQINDEDRLMALLARHDKQAAKVISFPKNSERGEQADAARANRGSTKY